MTHKITLVRFILMTTGLCTTLQVLCQDKVYLTIGKVAEGKITEVGPTQIKMLRKDPGGPVYIFNVSEVDSIVYADGKEEDMRGVLKKRGLNANIPQLNTWTLDPMGFLFFSVSQSYERRLKNGKVGFRIPLYMGFFGGNIAGEGMFLPLQGLYTTPQSFNGGWSMATGINAKFYLFKRRRVRAFIGPEADIGFSSVLVNSSYSDDVSVASYTGTFVATGKCGLSFNPVDKMNITIDGGAGIGNLFGGAQGIGWVGVWHVGFSIGTNF